MNKVLMTKGQGFFEELDYQCPTSIPNGIIVRNIMTGICTSDIAMMQGQFGPLPLEMQGHEGLAQVIAIGDKVTTGVKLGDYVATRGEPAYADYYPVRDGEYIVVPEAHPRYIIEPVACGINVVLGDLVTIQDRYYNNNNPKWLIIGSGFLAYVAYITIKNVALTVDVEVVGKSNKDIWKNIDVELLSQPNDGYDVVINLKEDHSWLENSSVINNNGYLIDAVGRSISKKESENLLWKAVTTTRPSPRKSSFYSCMELAVDWIKDNKLNVDKFWTRGYNRSSEWQQAFADGLNRPSNYSRGYIIWD